MALPTIRTRRILLRPWTRDDVDALHELWTAPEVRRYLWDDVVITRQTAEQVVDSVLRTEELHGIGCWTLYMTPDVSGADTLIDGFCGFRLIDEGPEIELLYGLRGEHWGKGLTTEAGAAALEYLWRATAYQQVYARTDPPNIKSVSVMQRLGMTHHSTTPEMISYVLRRPGYDESARGASR
jgi:RimJ/RimL family protein N-acetyltransferase